MLLLPPSPLSSVRFFWEDPEVQCDGVCGTEPLVGFQDAQVVDAVAPGKVQQDKGEDDLLVCPPLGFYVEMPSMVSPSLRTEPGPGRREVLESGHACIRFLLFILVRKESLWHNRFTSLVIDLVRLPYSIMLISQHQRGF